MNRSKRLLTHCLFLAGLCLPLLAGSSDPGPVAGKVDTGAITAEGEPLSILEQYKQFRRDRLSPTDLPGATGSAQHPSQYGPARNDPAQGIPKHAYSPFDPATSTQSHCPSKGCDYAPDAVLIKLKPEVSVAAPAAAGARQAAVSLDEPGVLSEPELARALWDQGLDELQPLFPGASQPVAGAMATRRDGVQVDLPDLTRWYRVKAAPAAQSAGMPAAATNPAPLDIPALVKELAASPGVELAEPDYVRKPIGGPAETAMTAGAASAQAAAPLTALFDTDPRVGEQWHLDAAQVPAAWQHLADHGLPAGGSSDVVVAVIDTGVDYTHPDLAANMWVNAGEFGKTVGVDDDGNGYVDDIHGARVIGGDLSGSPTDDHGHGTHVAGIIAAQADNGIGGVGVAPGVRIMAIKAAQYSGILNASDVARGIYYAVEKGADVINMSFGGYARSIAEEDALTVAFGSAVLVAAAGNHSKVNLPCPSGANMYPAAYNWVLGVMAHGENGRRASFSNFDCTQNDAQEYELMAPGTQILSTLPQDGYGAWSGTSMATPVVAGIAALARTQWPDKQSYSSRFIMGQIASTANYGPADALATLAEVPQPSLSYLEHYLFDTPQSAAGNDNDGIVDAGETVELAVVIRNHWGKADNVQVTLQAQAEGAFQADPYVTILTGTVNYGAVGSFNNDDNGLIKDAAGAIIGVEQPFRFHVADTTPNDHLIPFLLTMTADNGYDPGAGSVTSSSRFYLLVQRGRELPRVITQDMTLTKDDYWLVPSATLIPEGVTVTVTEGTQIQFFSADPSDPYAIPLFVQIQVEGNLFVQGTISEPVEFFTGLLYPAHPLIIAPTGNGDVRLAYSRISNPVLGGNQIDHVYFIQTDPNSLRQWLGGSWLGDSGSPTISSKLINATIFESMGTAMPVDIGGVLNGSLLDSTYITQTYKFESESPLISGVVNNVFLRNYKTINLPINDPVRQSKITLEPEGYSNFYNNAILNNWNILDIFNYWMRIYMSGGRGYMASASNNYWGTISTTLIDKAIYDFNDDFNLGVIQYQPILTTPPETAYPFVASVTVATNAGPATQIGAEPISVTVTFNRDMDPDVQPQVSFGPAEPYTDYSVGGDWTNARTWTGTFNVTPITGDGEQSIRVAGAVAADDAWLVTGNDFGRFRFEIITSGSSAMNLQASGGEGKVSLWWSQTDFDTLAGYHLYRSTSSNSGFSRLNATLIPRGLTTWEDTNVTPGQPYYYYFTVVETDFNESDPSATVTATPTDTIPPVISHTPITSAPPGQPLSLTATATDNVAVKSVTLYHRPLGGSSYASRAMIKTTGNSYSATLEGSLVSAPGIDYYLAASDGISVARSGSAALPWQVAVQDKPTLTSVTPASGPAEGGTSVTVTGTNFKAGATVTFGGAACGSVVRVSSTQITCTTPAHFPEQVDVIVTNPDTKSGTLLRGFTFISQTAALGVPNLTGGQGLLVQVPINIANVQGMLSAALTLSFDPAVLRIQGATTGSLTPGWTLVANTGVAGQVTLSMSSAGTVMGAGVLASLEFEVIGPPEASSPLTLSGVVLNDGAIPAETTNGSLTVDSVYSLSGSVQYWNASRPVPAIDLVLSGPRLYRGTSGSDGSYSVIGVPAGSYTLTPGGATAEGGISALDASLALRHQAGLETLSGNALKAADVNQNGSVTSHDASYILQRAAGLIDLPFQGAGSVWLFDPVVRNYTALAADQTGQNFTAILLGDPSGNWEMPVGQSAVPVALTVTKAATATEATLSLPTAKIVTGEQAVASVTLTLPEGTVQAADLEIHYDPAVVSVVKVDKGAAIVDWLSAINLNTAGVIRVSLAGATPIPAANGATMLEITFSALGGIGTQTALTWERGDLNEGSITGSLVDGGLTVVDKFALSLTLAGTGSGKVTSSPEGIDCGSDCSSVFPDGTEVTLTTSPASGSAFGGWSGACTGTGSCKVTMDAAKSLTATFTPISLQIADISQAEGDSGTTALSFQVSLSPASATAVSVQFATANGTATAGSDYTATSGSLTFDAGQINKSITVNVSGDTTQETDETFYVNLSNPSGASLADAQGLGTIRNDDYPSLAINDLSQAEGDSGTTSFSFSVSLSYASLGTVTVNYATANGTATAGSDYTATNGTLSFSPGQTSKSVTVSVQGDRNEESHETFFVNLSGTSGANLSDGQGQGTILNDERYDIGGTLTYWKDAVPVAGAPMNLSGSATQTVLSGANGGYHINDLATGNYSLSPSLPSTASGVTAYDASLVLRHSAGLAPLTGHALLAGDINRSGETSAMDASYILQLAVGLIDPPAPGAGSSWLFDPAQRSYTGLAADQTGQDFMAILLGDPSGNWPGSNLPLGALIAQASVDATAAVSATLTLPNLPIPSGQQVVVPLTLDMAESGVQAADLEFRYDPAVVTVVRVDRGDLPADWILAANDQASIGAIRASLAGATPVAAPEGRVFLRVTFAAKGSAGTVSDLLLPAGSLDEGGLASTVQPGMLVVGETFRGDDLALRGTVESKADYAASRSITLGPRLTLGATSNVTMRAGERIVFKPGFRVKAGARFAAAIDSGLTP